MANTQHLGIPKPEDTANVDEEFLRLRVAWDLVDLVIYELQQLVAEKAAADHGHTFEEIDGLVEALAEKMDTDASFNLDALSDVEGAAAAPPGYVLVKNALNRWAPSSPAAAIGAHDHSTAQILGLDGRLEDLDKLKDPWASFPIGVPIQIFLHLPGVTLPPKDKGYRYVLLTAGMTGSGQYNNGSLTGETVSGAAPTITATAKVSFVGSPFNGSVINLLNTSKLYLRPGTTNSIDAGQNLSHTHTATAASDSHSHTGSTSSDSHSHTGSTSSSGAHTHTIERGSGGSSSIGSNITTNNGGAESDGTDQINSAGAHDHTVTTSAHSHNHTVSTNTDTHTHTITVAADGGNENRPRSLNVQFIMRIA